MRLLKEVRCNHQVSKLREKSLTSRIKRRTKEIGEWDCFAQEWKMVANEHIDVPLFLERNELF